MTIDDARHTIDEGVPMIKKAHLEPLATVQNNELVYYMTFWLL